MPTPTFKRISVDQFTQLVEQFPFQRQISAVHMHHTWKPRRADFRGHENILSMWRHHTQTNGWRAIAQHITIDPEDMIWLGLNCNSLPASAAGRNGNAAFASFMFEMNGDFDTGRDPFDGAQRDTALRVVALVQQRFEMAPDTLRFHNMMSTKSCPGSALDYAAIVAEVDGFRQGGLAAAARERDVARGPFPDEAATAVVAIRRVDRRLRAPRHPAQAQGHGHGRPRRSAQPVAVDLESQRGPRERRSPAVGASHGARLRSAPMRSRVGDVSALA